MKISWYFGFGWVSILTLAACGIAINLLSGPILWVFYVPFLIVALYMTVRFRLYVAQPWRRVHGRAMLEYAELAGKEYDDAKAEGREFDIRVPCRRLGLHLLGENQADQVDAMLGDERKAYFRGLVEANTGVFLKGIGDDRRDAALAAVNRDIDASELAPDAMIARAIERQVDQREAARYLHALLLGRAR
ncbi:MAG TPA: hypothetical protein PLW68_13015 [Casimicrobiaceae bacterium]|nr:hypothetical protein [Casimicrobiaceae bacterium]